MDSDKKHFLKVSENIQEFIDKIKTQIKKIEEIKNALSSILSIVSRIISKLIEDLDYQESRLKYAESLLDSDVANLNPSELGNLLNSNNTVYLR